MSLTKYERNELRRLLREVVFERDGHKCVRCGKETTLAPSHVYPKGVYRRMEFDIDNVKTLCWRCHMKWWHVNIMDAKEWFEEKYPERAKRLKLRSMTTIRQKHPIDYKLIKLYLEQELEKFKAST